MKVTQVAICPTEASNQAGRPALTPELLAASGARYSRNNEGLNSILSKIDPNNLDKSVDGIFRMIDYGHQSIADMAPVAMFIDGVSLMMAYIVWSLCPTAGGQESSTRYIRYDGSGDSRGALLAPEALGIPQEKQDEWHDLMGQSLQAYARAVELWEDVAARNPAVTRIPRTLLEDDSDRAQKAVARMKRNYAFDRARNFLPVAAPTNLMLVMSARAWVNLCQHLLSHPLPEAQNLGEAIRDELALAAPRLLKHAHHKPSIASGQQRLWNKWIASAQQGSSYLADGMQDAEHPPSASLEVTLPPDVPADSADEVFASALEYHDNRYAWIGEELQGTVVRFGWKAVALAEIRDLNRHRTGTKTCPLVPVGFYAARDQWNAAESSSALDELAALGRLVSSRARALLADGDASAVYWTLLGTQYHFEHVTTADKFLYEAELRTGTGAHFRYASHLHDVLALWYEQFPATRGKVLEGSAEPE
jgi:thymidylate synthase ThyX